MNTLEITNYIAAMPAEVLDFLSIDNTGQRLARTILHPVPHDRAVFSDILDAEMTTLVLIMRRTGLQKVQVTRAISYLVDAGLVTVEGVRQNRTFFPAPNATAESELPEVKALPKGKKKTVVVDTAQSA